MKTLLFLVGTVLAAAEPEFTGIWTGVLNPGIKLRVALTLTKEAGALRGLFDSRDQGMTFPVTPSVDGKTLAFELQGARFTGDLEGDQITGKFAQSGMAMPLTLRKVERLESANRPQHPKAPYPYEVEEVAYGNGLAGTFTIPRSHGPFPAVLLLTGSGLQDRDSTIMEHKPFLVVADHLTRLGFAVLRVDDRGIGKSTGSLRNATLEDIAVDAVSGIAYLRGRPELDPKRIGIIGHSEGGIVAPMVAAKSNDVAFLVLLAGSGVPGSAILPEQVRMLLRGNGAEEAVVEREASKQADIQENLLTSPYMRSFLRHDPAKVLAGLKIPLLALNGEKDRQVSATQNLPAISGALAKAGNADYSIVCLPKLNHLFQTSETGMPDEYGKIEETFSPVALGALSEWLLDHASHKPRSK